MAIHRAFRKEVLMTKSLYRFSRVMVMIRRNEFGGFRFLASIFKVNELKASPRFYTGGR